MTPAPTLAVPLFLWPTPLDRKRLSRWHRAAVREALTSGREWPLGVRS